MSDAIKLLDELLIEGMNYELDKDAVRISARRMGVSIDMFLESYRRGNSCARYYYSEEIYEAKIDKGVEKE